MATKAGEFVPANTTIVGTEQRSVFYAGIDGVGIGEGWLDMPDALELPRMLGAVVPLMRGEGRARFLRGIVSKAIALNRRPLRGRVFSVTTTR